MANEHSYCFGVYLKITIKESEYEDDCFYCENDHKYYGMPAGDFCSKCGSPISKTPKMLKGFLTRSADVMDITDERLQDSTPPALYNTDTVIARSNIGDFDWLYLEGCYYNDEIKDQIADLPSQKEINRMIYDFSKFHKADIDLVAKSEYVTDVEVKFGYVLNAEY